MKLIYFNKFINKTKIIVSLVDRFIIRGRNSDYDIDAFDKAEKLITMYG